VLAYIQQCTVSFGKVKLVLERGRYLIESPHRDVLEELLRDDVIRTGSLQVRE
jgi:DNA excision repair protein ERCC-3